MLRNKTILITGGGSGIGEALAMQLAPHNTVIICGRHEEKLKRVAAMHPSITHHVMDVSDPASIDRLFASLSEKGIILNVLINNAGVVEIWDVRKPHFTSCEIFEKVNTNFSGAVALVQHFIRQADTEVENLIINNTSEIAFMPVPILPLYSSSKAALSVFTKAIRIQLKHTSFRVIELLPPAVDTAMPKQLNNTGKLMNADAFAKAAIRSIEKGALAYAPGANVPLLKFFQRFLPVTGLKLIDALSRKQLAGT